MMKIRDIAQVLMVLTFLSSGVFKVRDFSSTVSGFMKQTGLGKQVSQIAIALAAALQISASLFLIYDAWKNHQYKEMAHNAAMALAWFTVAATLVYHFPATGTHWYPFISNVAVLGGLLLI